MCGVSNVKPVENFSMVNTWAKMERLTAKSVTRISLVLNAPIALGKYDKGSRVAISIFNFPTTFYFFENNIPLHSLL